MKKYFGLMLVIASLSSHAQVEESVHPTEDYALFVTIKIKPGKVLEFKKALLPYAEKTKLEAGVLTYKIHQSAEDPTQFEYYAHFASKLSHENHLNQPHTKDYLSTAKPLFEEGYPIRKKVFELR